MVYAPEVWAAYLRHWIGMVEAETTGGRRLIPRVDEPKDDPDNS